MRRIDPRSQLRIGWSTAAEPAGGRLGVSEHPLIGVLVEHEWTKALV